MKKVYVFATLLLMAGMAMGQFKSPYVVKNWQATTTDITTQTATVNAWKNMNFGCTFASLAASQGTELCVSSNDSYVYKFNATTKGWDKQTSMGTGVAALAILNVSTIYSLQSAPQCTAPNMGIFLWTGSAWTQKGNCYTKIAGGMGSSNGSATQLLGGINNINQLFYSTDGGNSWTIQSGLWKYVDLGTDGEGCMVDGNNAMWLALYGQPHAALPSIPSVNGTVIGCIHTSDVTLAWTSTGWTYSMPQEHVGSWTVVAGISAKKIAGWTRFHIFAVDSGFKTYHWNVNAPTVSANYGGTWNPSQGCPVPTSQCNSNAQHTLKFTLKFTSGHGIGGRQNIATEPFSADIETLSSDTNPSCDLFVGADGECKASATGNATCDQSGADVGDEADMLEDGESTDVEEWVSWTGQNDGPNLVLGPVLSTYEGIVNNLQASECFVKPICEAQNPEGMFADCNFVNGDTNGESRCLAYLQQRFIQSELGLDSPFVYRSEYLRMLDANGNPIPGTTQCFASRTPDEFLWQNYEDIPPCN